MATATAVYVMVTSAISRGMKGDGSDLVQFHLGEGQAIPHGIPPGEHVNDRLSVGWGVLEGVARGGHGGTR